VENMNNIEDGIAAADAAISTHSANKNNPHEVTKAQVGLGNVQDVNTTNAANIKTTLTDAAESSILVETTKDSPISTLLQTIRNNLKYLFNNKANNTDVVKLTGDQTVAGKKTFSTIPELPASDPTSDNHAVRKAYVDALIQGLDPKGSCKAATTANITLSGTQTIDGVAVAAGDRVLVKNQTTASANGIYVVATGAWTRAADFSTGKVTPGAYAFVEQGTINGDTGWVLVTDGTITVGTTALSFTQFSAAGVISVSADDPLSVVKTGQDYKVSLKNLATTAGNATNGATQLVAGNNPIGTILQRLIDNISHLFANKVDKIAAITAVTTTAAKKIAFNAQGQITGAADLTALDFGRGYGTSDTAAATAAKVGTLTGFVRSTGAIVGIKFTNANTASSPTLNVNTTGAAAIIDYRTNAAPVSGAMGAIVHSFQFDGTNWVLLNPLVTAAGGGLTAVVRDDTLQGNGTSGNPLSVVGLKMFANISLDADPHKEMQIIGMEGSDMPGAPEPGWGYCLHFQHRANTHYARQIFLPFFNDDIYTRSICQGTIGGWVKLVSENSDKVMLSRGRVTSDFNSYILPGIWWFNTGDGCLASLANQPYAGFGMLTVERSGDFCTQTVTSLANVKYTRTVRLNASSWTSWTKSVSENSPVFSGTPKIGSDPVAVVANTSSPQNKDLPVGTYIMVCMPGYIEDAPVLNGEVYPYINTSNNKFYTTQSSSNLALSGTWRSCGLAGRVHGFSDALSVLCRRVL